MNTLSPYKIFLLLSSCFFCALSIDLNAQNVGINTSGASANASAILDLNTGNSGHAGFLAPQASLTAINDIVTIPSPATGLIVYNTNAAMTGGNGAGYYYYSGSQWTYFLSTASAGTVTSVGLTGPGGIFGISNTNGNPITGAGSFGITTSGTSGGIPYFSSTTDLSSSGLLTHYGIVYGGGAAGAPVATAALTNGQVLIGSTGAAPVPATITPAANSGISITNAAGSITIGTNGALNTIKVITNPTTSYTPSAGTNAIQVELIGGGGGGGSSSVGGSNGSAGGGGGAGGYVKFFINNPTGPYAVSVGAGGAGASAGGNGSAGTATTFAGGYSAGGGSGGGKGTANVAGVGGAGGAASGGLINITGAPGYSGIGGGSGGAVSGAGGSSCLGGGATPVSLTSAGSIAGNNGNANSGGGGSGCATFPSVASAAGGGSGANGIIIITEYK